MITMPQMNQQRILREIAHMQQFPPHGISIHQTSAEKINYLEVQLIGPDSSPYKGTIFNLTVEIPDNYPFQPPSIKFTTKIYHPNIDEAGRICLDVLKLPPKGSWKPTYQIENLLVAVRMLLETPNPDDPLMPEIAEEFRSNPVEFNKKAEKFCKLHAN